MKNWLVAVQTPYNEVKFITNHDDHYMYVSYHDFFDKISDFPVKDWGKYRDCIDEVGRVIILDTDSGEWERQPIDPGIEHSMEDLIRFNEQFVDEEKEDKKDRFKRFIKDFVRKDKSEIFKYK